MGYPRLSDFLSELLMYYSTTEIVKRDNKLFVTGSENNYGYVLKEIKEKHFSIDRGFLIIKKKGNRIYPSSGGYYWEDLDESIIYLNSKLHGWLHYIDIRKNNQILDCQIFDNLTPYGLICNSIDVDEIGDLTSLKSLEITGRIEELRHIINKFPSLQKVKARNVEELTMEELELIDDLAHKGMTILLNDYLEISYNEQYRCIVNMEHLQTCIDDFSLLFDTFCPLVTVHKKRPADNDARNNIRITEEEMLELFDCKLMVDKVIYIDPIWNRELIFNFPEETENYKNLIKSKTSKSAMFTVVN